MKKLITTVAVGLAATVGVAAAAAAIASASPAASSHPAAATTTTTTPPIQGTGTHKLFFYVDTITGGGSPAPAAGCAMTNLFVQGQVVVFRMFGVHVPTGGTDLTPATVSAAFVTIPGRATNIPMVWGSHGTASYWTAAWTTSKVTSIGVVNFTVTVVTKAVPKTGTSPAIPVQRGVFSQKGMPPPSQLTVVKA
ncbi:MAG: hypothetical protein ABSD78_15255 [Acidimicrobiales bacterium]|jgi:hypothetical protein